MVKTLGWPYPFDARPWSEIDTFLGGVADAYEHFRHMADIVRSVRTSGHEAELAGLTSMHDLLVVATPVPDLPYDCIAVRAPGSLHRPPAGYVRIEHLAVSGRNDSIDRPVAEAVPLFWRFVWEKFGVSAAARTRPGEGP